MEVAKTQMIVYKFTVTLLIPERSFADLPALTDRKAMSVDDSGLHRLKVRMERRCWMQSGAKQEQIERIYSYLTHILRVPAAVE